MIAKPMLAVEMALRAFPGECLTVLISQTTGTLKVTCRPGPADGPWHLEDGTGKRLDLSLEQLVAAAFHWLGGKRISGAFGPIWPVDKLRGLLEEVRRQFSLAPIPKGTERRK